MTPTPNPSTLTPTTSPHHPVNSNPNETVTRFDVPRGYDKFRIELDPEPTVDVYSFAMRDGDDHQDNSVQFDGTTITTREKYYIEIVPEGSVEVDTTVAYDHDGETTHAVDTTVTLHDSDVLWIALRAGTSRFGIVR